MERQSAQGVFRCSHDAFVGGVCSGIAERFDADAIVVRILFVLVTASTFGLGAIAYLALWALLPVGPEPHGPYDVQPEHAGSLKRGTSAAPCQKPGRRFGGAAQERELSLPFRLIIAVGLMTLFLVVSANVSSIVSGTQWWQFWPIAFLMAGLCLVVIPVRGSFEAAWHAAGIAITSVAAFLLPMSLGVVSWETLPRAFETAWPIVLASAVLCAAGVVKKSDTLIVVGAFCIAAFCLVGLLACPVAGTMDMLVLNMPDGTLMRIAIVQ